MRLDLKHRQPHPPANRFRDFRKPRAKWDQRIREMAVRAGLLPQNARKQG